MWLFGSVSSMLVESRSLRGMGGAKRSIQSKQVQKQRMMLRVRSGAGRPTFLPLQGDMAAISVYNRSVDWDS